MLREAPAACHPPKAPKSRRRPGPGQPSPRRARPSAPATWPSLRDAESGLGLASGARRRQRPSRPEAPRLAAARLGWFAAP